MIPLISRETACMYIEVLMIFNTLVIGFLSSGRIILLTVILLPQYGHS